MAGEVATAITSLGGVALGGGLSYLVQRNSQRAAAGMERLKQETTRTEARRAERLTHLERFVSLAADAERVAFERPADWTETDPWAVKAQDVMNRLWVAERMVQVLFPPAVHVAARTYFFRINGAVWQGVPVLEDLYPELDELRDAFLGSVREALG
jgi:hypothetical protein